MPLGAVIIMVYALVIELELAAVTAVMLTVAPVNVLSQLSMWGADGVVRAIDDSVYSLGIALTGSAIVKLLIAGTIRTDEVLDERLHDNLDESLSAQEEWASATARRLLHDEVIAVLRAVADGVPPSPERLVGTANSIGQPLRLAGFEHKPPSVSQCPSRDCYMRKHRRRTRSRLRPS